MDKNNNQSEIYIQEDEIDLRELFLILWKKKGFIVGFTFVITVLAIVYVFMKTPIYEVKSNVKLGFINIDDKEKLLVDSQSLNQELRIVFNVNDKSLNPKEAKSWVEDISVDKNVKSYIQIKTNGLSNEEALKKNKNVVEYIQKQNQITIDNFIRNTKLSIEETRKSLLYINNIEIIDVKRNIEKLKTQKIPEIDDKIKILNNKLNSIENKINFNNTKLEEYNKSINNLHKNIKKQSTAETMISSIQMLNYQNLILNTQNKLEDLMVEKSSIKLEAIPKLIVEKENIINDTIRKLEEEINITLGDKKISLENKIKNLEYQISDKNFSNSKVIGEYIINDYPVKPKKKLIVAVAFVTGFILSIFLVFFIDFIKSISRNQEKPNLL